MKSEPRNATMQRPAAKPRRRVLITGAGSGMAENIAIGLAKAGHDVIATVHVLPQIKPLRDKAKAMGLPNLRVEKLDILNPVDIAAALKLDFDILFSHAGIGEGGPVSEIPLELVRANFETNVFAPLALVQGVARKWIDLGQTGKIVLTSSEVGLFVPPGFGAYAATKHALEAIAQSLQFELKPFGIKVQTINPGAFATGFNQGIAEAAFRWLNDEKNFTKRAELQAIYDADLRVERDASEVVNPIIEIVESDSGKFRNVVLAADEASMKDQQLSVWSVTI